VRETRGARKSKREANGRKRSKREQERKEKQEKSKRCKRGKKVTIERLKGDVREGTPARPNCGDG
jgi:hypothetical protein